METDSVFFVTTGVIEIFGIKIPEKVFIMGYEFSGITVTFFSIFLGLIWLFYYFKDELRKEKSKEETSKEKVFEKINELNGGILNSNNIPSHFTASQCNNMGLLTIELAGYESELRQSLDKKRIKEIYKSLTNIEESAKAI